MSVRGLSALDSIGLGAHVASEYGIPMHSRMIHTLKGVMYPVPYGKGIRFGDTSASAEQANQLKGLILAQNERWRRGLGMQVVREVG